MRNRTRERLGATTFLVPGLVFSIAIVVYPIFLVVRYSFSRVKLAHLLRPITDFTAANYAALFGQSYSWTVISNTLLFTLCAAAVAYLIGLLVALLLNSPCYARGILRSLFILPWAIPPAITASAFLWLFQKDFGLINHVLIRMGLIDQPISWLTRPLTAFVTVVCATSWQMLPFFILMFLSGLQLVPQELHEAAHIDGANRVQRFRYITGPAIRSISSVSIVLGVLSIFRSFEIIWLMTQGGPLHATEVLSISLYREAFVFYDIGRASVFGVTTLLLSTGVLVSFWPLVKKKFF